ncbi:MAG: hypothetical protein KatS3mg103_1282 [Phycisphaerales bacterium]|nr:MAG: hypothetical protein KatS3mg103_1282 [Phycisphaerales bacterium]
MNLAPNDQATAEQAKPVETVAVEPSRRLPIQVAIVAGVLVVAAGVIAWMHHRGVAPAKSLKPVEMKYSIEQTQARHYEGEQRILRSLALAGPPPQVPVEEIRENPFRLERAPKDEGPIQPADLRPVRDQTLVRAEQLLDTLRIEMVLNSETNPLAKINGKVYRVGDKIEDVLEIVGISGRSVTFRAKTLLRTVEMKEKR